MLDIVKAYAVKNLGYITAQKMIPQGIVVHSTGANNPNLKRYVDAVDEVGINQYGNHWNTATPGGRKVCVHAFIGYDKNKQVRVAEILPLDICCWGVGSGKKGSYNYNPAYIQFEICEDGRKDKTYYKKAFSVAAEYCAELCRAYNISIDKIVGHCEAYRLGYGSNHGDPEHWMKNFGETMDDFRMITEDNFFEFQNLIRQSCGGNVIDPPNPNEDPRVKRMKAKARERDRVKAKSGKGIRFDTTIVSICCMDLGLNPLNIGKLSYCALTDLMNTYQKKEKYQLDIDSLLAGADSKKVKPKYWISNE